MQPPCTEMIQRENIDEENQSMAVGADAIFCRRYPVFHSQQHLRCHVQEHGHAERNAGPIHQPAISPLGNKTPLESFCRYNQKQEMVDHNNADPDVCGNAYPVV